MHNPHLPTFAVTALSLPYAPIAGPAIERSNAVAALPPVAAGIVGALAHPLLPGSQEWQ